MISPLRKTILVLCTMLLWLTATGWTQPAAAQDDKDNTYWARWSMEIDFENDTVNARWTVFLGATDSHGEMYIKNQKTQLIACKTIGNIPIKNGVANFDGTSHLECPVPSFYAAVAALAGGSMPFPDTIFNPQVCKCKNPRPWVAADLTVGNPSGVISPLVYQADNDMQFAVIQDSNYMATSLLTLNDGEKVNEVLSWPINLDGNQIWSGSGAPNFLVMTDPAWYQFLNADFYTLAKQLSLDDYFHWANTAPQGIIFNQDAEFHMTNESTIFMVGYNEQNHFVGQLKKLAWDPPCGPQDGK